jgi:hypothetical protein
MLFAVHNPGDDVNFEKRGNIKNCGPHFTPQSGDLHCPIEPAVNRDGGGTEKETLIASFRTQTMTPVIKRRMQGVACQVLRVLSGILFRWPANGVVAVVHRMGEILDSKIIREGDTHVSTFYVYPHTASTTSVGYGMVFFLPFVGIAFGAIHCAGWNFFFPSLVEANIWRISSAIITGVPAIGLLLLVLQVGEDPDGDNSLVIQFVAIVSYLTFVTLPFYVLARIALLVEALVSLRDLPLGALAVVEWTSFIPHV